MYLFPQLWLALLDCGHHHVPDADGKEPVQLSLDPHHGGDVEIFGSCVVCTVDDPQGDSGKCVTWPQRTCHVLT